MSSKTIPQKYITTCDRCGCEAKDKRYGCFEPSGMRLVVEAYGTDCFGNLGGAKTDYDFCSVCSIEFKQFLKHKAKDDE